MKIRDLFHRKPMRPDDPDHPMETYRIAYDPDGVKLYTSPEAFAELRRGQGQRSVQEQHLILESLEEQGAAKRMPNGYALATKDVVRLADEEASILGLPPRFPGRFDLKLEGNTTSPRFAATLRPELDNDRQPLRRTGPVITFGIDTTYRLWPRALAAIEAVEHYDSLSAEERTEPARVHLVARLQAAKALSGQGAADPDDLDLSLGYFDSWSTIEPDRVGLIVDEQSDGSLRVSPDLGPGVDPDALDRRWHHLRDDQPEAVIRVDQQLVLLKEDQRKGVEEVLSNRIIPRGQRQQFLQAPGDFYSPDYVDVDLNFGVRVEGIGIIVPQTFVDASESEISWFGDTDEVKPTDLLAGMIETLPELDQVAADIDAAQQQGHSVVAVGDEIVDISDHAAVDQTLTSVREKLLHEAASQTSQDGDADTGSAGSSRRVQVGMHVTDAAELSEQLRANANQVGATAPVDYDALLRSPYRHQRDGIEWLTRLMGASLAQSPHDPARVQGAILADDMGLGKTYMTLVAVQHFLQADRAAGNGPRPTLAVLPLSLIENWQDEIAQTLGETPFDDIVILQSDHDLKRFRHYKAGRETSASSSNLDSDGMLREDAIRFSLRVGESYGRERLDMPGRLVLTTYQALSSYQLSLAQVDWGCVIFDEAQNMKNPDALTTRAAKGLKASFKLLATGTPIENKMLDFWCLMDTAQPGLLGSWSDFRSHWVTPMDNAEGQEKQRIGDELREFIGPFMLRRVKEDHLDELPMKTVYAPEANPGQRADAALGVTMPPAQRDDYDQVLEAYRHKGGTKGAALAAVQGLRSASLHPFARNSAPASGVSADEGLGLSARMIATIQVLDRVRAAGEKAIVFVITKKVQTFLALWLQERYGLHVRIVNGETQASARAGSETRKQIIDDFESVEGFNVIIMSPLAVGVGLTVVGANHAIHLERHWNPAKEAQATDRIYRIGQKKPVHVYLPMALHPDQASFDLNLNRLLQQKTVLKDAVVVPESVRDDELSSTIGIEG